MTSLVRLNLGKCPSQHRAPGSVAHVYRPRGPVLSAGAAHQPERHTIRMPADTARARQPVVSLMVV
jgi:hypothetical protein